ncbi:hypothetical protein IZ6_18890 [Terrihabitans soli]|uniref:Lipoprotein n=1 Tax=Terrihabitans soli TaxID=708113 RepID=A0A6S6QL85_9HYPH|nr:hypothetical protein [Terrihabitans soli]BCJ91154.1 hypothetical protein IZ6_18890 [Terrihabitans soli]
MRLARFAPLAALCLALGGCFDVGQTLKVTSESEAVFEVRAAVPASTIAAAQSVPGLADRPFCADKEAAEKLGLKVTVETMAEGPDQICLMKAQGSLAQIAKVAADKSYLPKDAPPTAGNALVYDLEPAGGGLWRLTVVLSPPPEVQALAGADEITKAAQSMIFGSTAGKGIGWAVEAKEIVESSGTVSPDKTRAEFEVPLSELLSKPEPEYRFVTTFRP